MLWIDFTLFLFHYLYFFPPTTVSTFLTYNCGLDHTWLVILIICPIKLFILISGIMDIENIAGESFCVTEVICIRGWVIHNRNIKLHEQMFNYCIGKKISLCYCLFSCLGELPRLFMYCLFSLMTAGPGEQQRTQRDHARTRGKQDAQEF